LGGGFGHVSRALKVIHTLNLPPSQVTLLCSAFPAPFAALDTFSELAIEPIPADCSTNPEQLGPWVYGFLEGAERLIVDTFAGGILGELTAVVPRVRVDYIARIIKPAYLHGLASLPAFHTCYSVERLPDDMREFIATHACHCKPLCLKSFREPTLPYRLLEPGTIVVFHSGSEVERALLLDYAVDIAKARQMHAKFLVSGEPFDTQGIKGVEFIDPQVAPSYLPDAELVVSACGFNIMDEMSDRRDKHYFMPLERGFDDQFLRAHYARAPYIQEG
jgi:hypothetical protein